MLPDKDNNSHQNSTIAVPDLTIDYNSLMQLIEESDNNSNEIRVTLESVYYKELNIFGDYQLIIQAPPPLIENGKTIQNAELPQKIYKSLDQKIGQQILEKGPANIIGLTLNNFNLHFENFDSMLKKLRETYPLNIITFENVNFLENSFNDLLKMISNPGYQNIRALNIHNCKLIPPDQKTKQGYISLEKILSFLPKIEMLTLSQIPFLELNPLVNKNCTSSNNKEKDQGSFSKYALKYLYLNHLELRNEQVIALFEYIKKFYNKISLKLLDLTDNCITITQKNPENPNGDHIINQLFYDKVTSFLNKCKPCALAIKNLGSTQNYKNIKSFLDKLPAEIRQRFQPGALYTYANTNPELVKENTPSQEGDSKPKTTKFLYEFQGDNTNILNLSPQDPSCHIDAEAFYTLTKKQDWEALCKILFTNPIIKIYPTRFLNPEKCAQSLQFFLKKIEANSLFMYNPQFTSMDSSEIPTIDPNAIVAFIKALFAITPTTNNENQTLAIPTLKEFHLNNVNLPPESLEKVLKEIPNTLEKLTITLSPQIDNTMFFKNKENNPQKHICLSIEQLKKFKNIKDITFGRIKLLYPEKKYPEKDKPINTDKFPKLNSLTLHNSIDTPNQIIELCNYLIKNMNSSELYTVDLRKNPNLPSIPSITNDQETVNDQKTVAVINKLEKFYKNFSNCSIHFPKSSDYNKHKQLRAFFNIRTKTITI